MFYNEEFTFFKTLIIDDNENNLRKFAHHSTSTIFTP